MMPLKKKADVARFNNELKARIRSAREEHIKHCEDRWAETVWAIAQEFHTSEDEIYSIEEDLA